MFLYASTTVGMVLDALLVCCCIGLFCHCKITAYVGDNKLILILSYLILLEGYINYDELKLLL